MERKLSVVAGDRDSWIDLRYASLSGLKGGRLTISNVAKLAIKRNSKIIINLVPGAPCVVIAVAISLWKKKYYKIPDIRKQYTILISLAL